MTKRNISMKINAKLIKTAAIMLCTAFTFSLTSCVTNGGNTSVVDTTEETIAETAGETESESTSEVPVTEPMTPREEVPYELYVPTAHEMRDITGFEATNEIKTGWNLGNTFDALTETGWGNPQTTYTMIYAVKEAGFDSVRLPVTWDSHTGAAPEYKINEEWLTRVEEVVGYVLSAGMYCIINTHHESWIFPEESKEEQISKRLIKVWEQLCERFSGYNEKLIFEAMNEPRLVGTEFEWTGGTEESRGVVNRLNGKFVETVRNTGGNNAKRLLMIPSYAASVEKDAL
jgi:aryl-phospho-beta-D-glucosidase BglC (GH1 family)